MKNTVDDLRNHLFATLEALQDPEKPMEVARAKAISEVAQTIINSAKVEIELLEATCMDASDLNSAVTFFKLPHNNSSLLLPKRACSS